MTRPVTPAPERVVRLHINGEHRFTWTASPGDLDALAAGRLLTAGYLRAADDLRSLQVHEPDHGAARIDAVIADDALAAGDDERRHRAEHGCGLRFLIDCRPDLVARQDGDAARPPDPDRFPDLFRELFDRSLTRRGAGGHHSAALSDGVRVVHLHEEVSRHNAADRAIGAALLAGDRLRELGLLTTARISGEMAEKAVRVGLAWVASRSVPTTLAVELAAAAGVPLVGRAASPEARVFGG